MRPSDMYPDLVEENCENCKLECNACQHCHYGIKEFRKRENWQRCGGDPREIVYKDITREDIFTTFSMDERYSVNTVAGKLGLTYM